jgi:hypothetical protein
MRRAEAALGDSFPRLVAHADWSAQPRKRWLARALWRDGRYHVCAPEPAGPAETLLARLRAAAPASAAILAGFDFPIGLPRAYAAQVGVTRFLDLLPRLGEGRWRDFYRVAATPEELGLVRPFYPQRPGRARRQHLLDGLNVTHIDDLRRACDLPQPGRRAAAPLFWTMGAQQVGKAAISGWRDVLGPALRDAGQETAIWPFSGALPALLQPGRIVIAEAYPAEFYGHLGVAFPRRPGRKGGKRVQADRAANAPVLLDWAARCDVALSAPLRAAIVDGFGAAAEGEDPFDAVVGLLGMLNTVLGQRPFGAPADPLICQVEGWILGQAVAGGEERGARCEGQ